MTNGVSLYYVYFYLYFHHRGTYQGLKALVSHPAAAKRYSMQEEHRSNCRNSDYTCRFSLVLHNIRNSPVSKAHVGAFGAVIVIRRRTNSPGYAEV